MLIYTNIKITQSLVALFLFNEAVNLITLKGIMPDSKFKGKYLDGDREEVLYTSGDNGRLGPKLLEAEDDVEPSDSAFLYISTFTANLIMFSCGCTFAWSSPVFPKLKETDPNINPLGKPVTPVQESLVAAIMCLGAALGPLIAGKLANSIGRKQTLLMAALPKLVGYIGITFIPNINVYYLGRFLMGLGLGSIFAVLPMYTGEITQDHNRGKFSCFITVFVTLGLLYPFAVGPLLSVRLFTFSCAIPLMLFYIFFSLFIPESPTYLVTTGNKNQAEEALVKLRNKSRREVQVELQQIIRMVEKEEGGNVSDLFKSPGLKRAFTISTGVVIIQQFSGINAVTAFLEPIFAATGSDISPYTSSVAIGIIQIITTFLAASFVEKLGRKFLLLGSTIGCSASILLLGLYFYIKNNTLYSIDSIFWLPIVCLIIYIVSFNIGLGPLPWALVAEIFPSNVRSVAASLTSFVCFMASFGVTMGFPLIVEHVGMAQCFWIFGFVCILGIVFIYVIVLETKGKSLVEIQQLLRGR